MKEEEILKKIKSRGFWRINIRPSTYNLFFSKSSECLTFVRKNIVDFTGWDYPHFAEVQSEIQAVENYSDFGMGWSDAGPHKEYWRLYRSGQFIHYMCIGDDWWEDDFWKRDWLMNRTPMTHIGAVYDLLSPVTSIFEFCKKLAEQNILGREFNLSIQIIGLKNRKLWMQSDKLVLARTGVCKENEFKEEKVFTSEEIILNTQELSLQTLSRIYDLFKWNVSLESLKVYQNNLKERGDI